MRYFCFATEKVLLSVLPGWRNGRRAGLKQTLCLIIFSVLLAMPDKSKLTEKELRKVIPYCISYAQVLCKIGLAPRGGNYATLKRKIFEYKIDISHFKGKGWNTGLRFKPNQVVSIHEILVEGSSYQSFKLKKRLLAEKLKERKCESCGLTRWLSKPIALELHHINGVANDNRLENLQLLCPNCHALTDNYRGKNAGKEYF